MANKMLIDAAHPEETRVVVVRGNRVEEFDFEAANRKQLRGNIYLAKVTRVEPSLQAAFVEYGGNRHGFLAFSEIHPDYYQIPVADRQALLEAEQAETLEDDQDEQPKPRTRRKSKAEANSKGDVVSSNVEEIPAEDGQRTQPQEDTGQEQDEEPKGETEPLLETEQNAVGSEEQPEHDSDTPDQETGQQDTDTSQVGAKHASDDDADGNSETDSNSAADLEADTEDQIESVGAEDALEEVPVRKQARRQYKIQEVIKRRQVILVQVVKEERGNKGAALTTYLSLAGRYSVLMPNTGRGGGISRKITQPTDRKRLKKIASELDVPEGMGVILRTAGASRTKAEIKRDFEYLMRLWENVRELTLKSSAPSLVYEEGSLIKRSIRDLYNKDIDEVLVAGDEGYREAKDFMRMLMPSHAKNVQPYREASPVFIRYGVEPQLDAMFSPQVTLKSGGYIVINQTEALVSIDVNSGKSTREHNIEDTALQTNLEAAEEVTRQLRLRDLAGLVVIDFIDMEENKNNRAVERKLKECLKNDRARIQVGRISHFGLLEMSRQRIRTGVLESSTTICPHCQGTGIIRSVESVALHVLRSLEDNLLKGVSHNLIIRTTTEVALYILNQKRRHLSDLESRFTVEVEVQADHLVNGQLYLLERSTLVDRDRQPQPPNNTVQLDTVELTEDDTVPVESIETGDKQEDGERDRRRRRRRKRRRDNTDDTVEIANSKLDSEDVPPESDEDVEEDNVRQSADGDDEPRRKRRRGRRGGRRGRRLNDENDVDSMEVQEGSAAAEPETAETASSEEDLSSERVDDTHQAVDDAAADTPAADAGVVDTAEEETAPMPASSAEPAVDQPKESSFKIASSLEEIQPVSDRVPPEEEVQQSETSEEDTSQGESDEDESKVTIATPAPSPEPAEPVVTSETAGKADAASTKPKRGGWWQRRSFF